MEQRRQVGIWVSLFLLGCGQTSLDETAASAASAGGAGASDGAAGAVGAGAGGPELAGVAAAWPPMPGAEKLRPGLGGRSRAESAARFHWIWPVEEYLDRAVDLAQSSDDDVVVSAQLHLPQHGRLLFGYSSVHETGSDDPVVYGRPFVWTEESGTVGLEPLAQFESSLMEATNARGKSRDESALFGNGLAANSSGTERVEAVRWTAEDGTESLTPGIPSIGMGINDDGSVVVGTLQHDPDTAFRWSEADGVQDLGTLPGYESSEPLVVSGDGRRVLGAAHGEQGSEPFLWTTEDGMTPLGLPTGAAYCGMQNQAESFVDGFAAIGTCWMGEPGSDQLFVWTEAGGLRSLAVTELYPFCSASLTFLAEAGVVVATCSGSRGTMAFRWTEESGMVPLGVLPAHAESSAHLGLAGVSLDGSVVIGHSVSSWLPDEAAFRWTEQAGMVELAPLAEHTRSRASSMSGDGSTVVGVSSLLERGRLIEQTPAIWDASGRVKSVEAFLEEQGVDTEDFVIETAAATRDGKLVGGAVDRDGVELSWVFEP